MSLFWIFVGLVAVISSLWIARPFLTRGSVEVNDAEGAISVFRDQRDEVERDLDQGLISETERDAAQREIQRRALKAAREMDGGIAVLQRSFPTAGAIALTCAVLALGSYAFLGAPDRQDQPLAARKTEVLERRAAAGDINSRIALLIERTSKNPDSFEDWWTLGASHAAVGDYASAVDAYRRAAELGGDRPAVLSAYAEAMVLANGNKVPKAARVIFEQVLQSAPDPRARYYVALSKAQAQDFEAALSDWAALAGESAPEAPWMPLVRRDIVNMARFLEVDVTDYLPDANAAEIAKAGGASNGETALARATELERVLADEPLDFKAWIELAELRNSLGDSDAAKSAIEQARTHYAAAPFVLQRIDQAAQSLGLDILQTAAGTRGPTDEDIAAAGDMSEADRGAMVEGMVAGLAAKLEENPDNPDGWIMLVRSYSVLGKEDKAKVAYETAVEHFDGNNAALDRLRTEAGGIVREN